MLGACTLWQQAQRASARSATWQWWMRRWATGLLHSFGVEQLVAGPPPEPAAGARLVVANHRSPLDIPLILSHFGGCVLSRSDLADWPLLGLAARRADTIFVDRDNPHSGMRAIREIRRRLRAGRTVVAFPEGSTFEGDEVRPFRGGILPAVSGLSVEIVPVGIAYTPGVEFGDETFPEHLRRIGSRRRTIAALCFGTPSQHARFSRSDLDGLHRSVQELVHRARDLHTSPNYAP